MTKRCRSFLLYCFIDLAARLEEFQRARATINYMRITARVTDANQPRKARAILPRSPLCACFMLIATFVNRASDRSAAPFFLSLFSHPHLILFPEKSFAKEARAAAARTSALGNNRGYDCYRLRAFRPHNSCNSQHRKRGYQRANVQTRTRAKKKKTQTGTSRVRNPAARSNPPRAKITLKARGRFTPF